MSDAAATLKKTFVSKEELLESLKKTRIGVEELLASDALVYFENIFGTRHIGRVMDLMLFKCRGFIDASLDPGYTEYRFRQIIELLIFNGWSNYRNGERSKMIDIEVGWDKHRMVVSVGAMVDDGVSGFQPGNIEFARDDASIRMSRMFGFVQELADGLIIRHDPRTGRIQTFAFIAADDEQKLASPEYVDLEKLGAEPALQPEPSAATESKPETAAPVELGKGELDLFLKDENAGPPAPGEEPAAKAGAPAKDDFEQRFKKDTEEDFKQRVAGSKDKADDFLQVIKGGGGEKSESEPVVRFKGDQAPAADDTVTRFKGDTQAAKLLDKDEEIGRFSKGSSKAQDDTVTHFKGDKKPESEEREVVARFGTEKSALLSKDEEVTRFKSDGKDLGADRSVQRIGGGMGVPGAVGGVGSGAAAGAGAPRAGMGVAAAQAQPGRGATGPSQRELLLASQVDSLKKLVETLQIERKTVVGSKPGEVVPRTTTTAKEAMLTGQVQSMQRQLDTLKTEKKVLSERLSSSGAGAEGASGTRNASTELRLTNQLAALQRQVESLQAEKKSSGDKAVRESADRALTGKASAHEKQLLAQVESLKKQLGAAAGAGAGGAAVSKSSENERQLSNRVTSLQKKVEELEAEKKKVTAKAVTESTERAGLGKASAQERQLLGQVQSLQRQVETLQTEKKTMSEKATTHATDSASLGKANAHERQLTTQVESLKRQLESAQAENKALTDKPDYGKDGLSEDAPQTPREKQLDNQVKLLKNQIETLQGDRKSLLTAMAESTKVANEAVAKARANKGDDEAEKEIARHKQEIETSQVSDPAKDWVRGMMEQVVRERAEIRQKVVEVDGMLRKKEHEFRTQEHGLTEQVRRLEQTIKQRDMAIERSKDTMASLQNTIDKVREAGVDSQDKVELAHKLITAEKLLDSEKNNLERMQKRLEDGQKKVADEMSQRAVAQSEQARLRKQVDDLTRKLADAQAVSQKSSTNEVAAVTEQRDKNARVIEELKRQNQELQAKLTSIAAGVKGIGGGQAAVDKKGGPMHSDAEMKYKLELAEKINKGSKDENEKLKKRLEESKNQESKLRGEVAKLQGEIAKLQTEVKAAGLRTAAAAQAGKPGGLKPK